MALVYCFEDKIQRVTFTDFCFIDTLVYNSAGFPCQLCGIIGRIICDDISIYKLLRILLRFNAIDKMTDNGLFVPCRYDHAYLCSFPGCFLLRLGLIIRPIAI